VPCRPQCLRLTVVEIEEYPLKKLSALAAVVLACSMISSTAAAAHLRKATVHDPRGDAPASIDLLKAAYTYDGATFRAAYTIRDLRKTGTLIVYEALTNDVGIEWRISAHACFVSADGLPPVRCGKGDDHSISWQPRRNQVLFTDREWAGTGLQHMTASVRMQQGKHVDRMKGATLR
jgi:hypothetical protein